MAHARTQKIRRLDPRAPLVFDTRTLGPASARKETRTVPAPADLGAGMVHVPVGVSLSLDVQLEHVSEGVLVTASVTVPLAGECARCLDEFTSQTSVWFRELFAEEAGGSGDDGYLLDGYLLDLEPALRDAVVLELPLSPLCAADCPGLCSRCGARLVDAGPDHGHADEDDEDTAGQDSAAEDGASANGAGQDRALTERTSMDGTSDPVGTKER